MPRRPSWHEQIVSIDERPVLVLFDGWSSLFRDRVVPWRIGMAEKTRLQFETDTLPRFIETQRWYAAKGTPIERARIADHVLWQEGKIELGGGAARGGGRRARRASYFMPLALAWEERDEERRAQPVDGRHRQGPPAGERRRHGRCLCRRGLLPRAWSAPWRKPREIADGAGQAAIPADGGVRPRWPARISTRFPVARPQGSSSNTVVVMGERLILKGYRRLRTGASPELEMGLYLTEVVHYAELRAAGRRARIRGKDGEPRLLAMLQALRRQSGRRLDLLARIPAAPPRGTSHRAGHRCAARRCARGLSGARSGVLAVRTAELHRALAHAQRRPGCSIPSRSTRADIEGYRSGALTRRSNALALLKSHLEQLPPADRDRADAVLAQQDRVLARIEALSPRSRRGTKIRIHGDYHLGQVLVTPQRLRHHRLRGRARTQPRGAARQAVAAARRRRHAALLQLRRAQRAAQRRARRSRIRQARAAGARLGERGARGLPRGL